MFEPSMQVVLRQLNKLPGLLIQTQRHELKQFMTNTVISNGVKFALHRVLKVFKARLRFPQQRQAAKKNAVHSHIPLFCIFPQYGLLSFVSSLGLLCFQIFR